MLTQTPVAILELAAWPRLADFEYRALRREDLPALFKLLLRIEQADERSLVSTLEDLQREYDDPWSIAETDSLVAGAARDSWWATRGPFRTRSRKMRRAAIWWLK